PGTFAWETAIFLLGPTTRGSLIMSQAKTHVLAFSIVAGLLGAFPIQAQNSASQHLDNGAKKMTSSADTVFAMKTAQSGMAEVKFGQLPAEKASDPDVKAFAQK